MLGSTIVNHQQHSGLQKLSAWARITPSLGPNKNYKFIQDDTSGESALVCSCFRICENLELTCTVGQLVYETIQAHQKVYNTGSGCLLFLAGTWSRAALECLQRGISVSHIISVMSEGIDICIEVCRKCKISNEGLGVVQSCTTMSPSGLHLSKKLYTEVSQACHFQGSASVCHKTLNPSGQRKIRLSRHFSEAQTVSKVPQSNQPKVPNIAHIAEGLSHGCIDAMNLVMEANRLQSKNNLDMCSSTFDVSKVVTCVLPGLPEENACVLPGCVVLLSAEQATVAHRLKEDPLKVALINGDLSHAFRHLGFSRPAGVQRVCDRSALLSSNKEEEWMSKVVALLLNLEVNLILVRGLASDEVIRRCCRHHVLVVEKVKASVLRTLANATGAVPVTYATQLSKHCVGTGVKVSTWRDLGCSERKSSTAVNISTDVDSGLVTVILASRVYGKLQALEDQFWACAYRLHHALNDKALLPGAGATEMLCIYHLQKQAERTGECQQQSKAGGAVNPFRGIVLHLMADGLIDYICTVMANTGRFTKLQAKTVVSQQLQDFSGHPGIAANFSQLLSEGDSEDGAFSSATKCDSSAPAMKIYDNLSVKQEAWRKALDLVFLVLQTDAEVITGIDTKNGSQDNVMLL